MNIRFGEKMNRQIDQYSGPEFCIRVDITYRNFPSGRDISREDQLYLFTHSSNLDCWAYNHHLNVWVPKEWMGQEITRHPGWYKYEHYICGDEITQLEKDVDPTRYLIWFRYGSWRDKLIDIDMEFVKSNVFHQDEILSIPTEGTRMIGCPYPGPA